MNFPYRLAGIVIVSATYCSAASAQPDQIRKAAEKAVALLQASQKNWKQNCSSCHQQALPSLAYQAARERGIAVNETLAHAADVQGYAFFADLDRAVQFTHIIDPAMSESLQLLGAFAAGVRPSLSTALYARMIASHQKPDGHWDTLDARPPQSYSNVSATATALGAMQIYSHPSQTADVKACTERARQWLAGVHPRDTEESTMQILGLFESGAPKKQIGTLAAALLAAQQADGGWRAVPTRASDAYSTGEALVVLHQTGAVTIDNPAWQNGLQFLLRTQAADGSWHVVSRLEPPAPVSPPYFETGYPYGHDQFISAMGASWAIRALADALGAPKGIKRPELREGAPADTQAWMETVAFGSAGDVKGLIDKGFDVNSATSGGTTALMMAMPDVEKANLLLARGAKVNARARTKYSALMVAAQYPGSSAAMRLLLDRGAEVQMAKGAGTPLFNASPLVLAATSGNADVLPRLLKAGAGIDTPITTVGLFPTTPLQSAVFFGDAATARVLLDNGAAIDLPDDDGITPLGWATINNHPEVARLLIERQADVNHVDKKGMTPLLYAASIGFGDAEIAELLLKSGANANAKSKERLTAAELAKKYRHAQLFKSFHVGE
jgi:ankyrin repeat protein